jgi:hypothetical protein
MFSLMSGYLILMGTAAATLQVFRGAVRGAGKLVEGDGRGALSEVAGGLVAPARAVYVQIRLLCADACQSAGAIATDETPEEMPLINAPRLRRRRAVEANGAPTAMPAAAQ